MYKKFVTPLCLGTDKSFMKHLFIQARNRERDTFASNPPTYILFNQQIIRQKPTHVHTFQPIENKTKTHPRTFQPTETRQKPTHVFFNQQKQDKNPPTYLSTNKNGHNT